LEEDRLHGGYRFPELDGLSKKSVKSCGFGNSLVFETQYLLSRDRPLNQRAYLVFPELNKSQAMSVDGDNPLEEGVPTPLAER